MWYWRSPDMVSAVNSTVMAVYVALSAPQQSPFGRSVVPCPFARVLVLPLLRIEGLEEEQPIAIAQT